MQRLDHLYYNTVSPLLTKVLKTLMMTEAFNTFRVVGGTALSLQLGHRKSMDIDLFSDDDYGSIDFDAIHAFLKANYPYIDPLEKQFIGLGTSYFVGESRNDCIKLDLFYTDKFLQKYLLIDGIRMACVEDIIAMKLDVISRGGRKKDFWDLHELINFFSLLEMLEFHKKRYPYHHDPELIKGNLINFSAADNDFQPVCLKGKHWEIIKLDMIEFAG